MSAIPEEFDRLSRIVANQIKVPSLNIRELNSTEKLKLKSIDLYEFASMEFPPREPILDPILCKQDLAMLYAERGVGKTHAALAIALAVSSGGEFAGWRASKPRKVCYLDGELQGSVMQQRLLLHLPDPEPPQGKLSVFNPDILPLGVALPDLSTIEGQDAIEPILDDAELVIVDNLSCWARVGKENEAESWLPLADWGLRLRRRGTAVLFVHHAGRNGQPRGTSKREDLMDTVIELKRPTNYDARDGAHFVLNFTKGRHLSGDQAQSLELRLETLGDKASWRVQTLEASTRDRVIELYKDDWSQTEIATELNIHKSTVSRHLRDAKNQGKIKEKP